jgi:predicted HicB family RNase H-like nuclease
MRKAIQKKEETEVTIRPSKIAVRLPRTLHIVAKLFAARDGVYLNELVREAVDREVDPRAARW